MTTRNCSAATLELCWGQSQYGLVKTHTQIMSRPTPDRGISIWTYLSPYPNHACHEMPRNATAATLEPCWGQSQYGLVKTHTQIMSRPTPDGGISIWTCLSPYPNHARHEMLLQHYSHCRNIRAVPGAISVWAC